MCAASFTFVNADASNVLRRPSRYTVGRHVQAYRRQKRVENSGLYAVNESNEKRPQETCSIAQRTKRGHNLRWKLPCRRTSHKQAAADPHEMYETSVIVEVRGILDPFLRLPIKLSDNEQRLVHFYLQDGRRLLFGTSLDPSFCPAFDMAKRGIERCTIWAYMSMVVSENFFCRQRNLPASASMHERRATAYRIMRSHLTEGNDPDSSIAGLLNLQTLELAFQRLDLQAMHRDALELIVASRGGAEHLMPQWLSDGSMINVDTYRAQFMWSQYTIRTEAELHHLSQAFISCIRSIYLWSQRRGGSATEAKDTTNSCSEQYYQLKKYLYEIIDENLSNPGSGSFYQLASTFNLIFNLSWTQMKCCNDDPECCNFLITSQRQLQALLAKAAATDREGNNMAESPTPRLWDSKSLHPSMVVKLLNIGRNERMGSAAQAIEVELYAASINALKVMPLLSSTSVARLAYHLADCVFASHTVSGDLWDPEYINELQNEIESNWETRSPKASTCRPPAQLANGPKDTWPGL